MKPLISVVVPVYNVSEYLGKCIQSIIDQTYQNLEIILVDDGWGGVDTSGDICDKYAEIDKRIKVIHQTNAGLSEARNSGINIAKGEYIGFVDGDDWIEPQMYNQLISHIINDDSDMAICDFRRVSNELIYGETISMNQNECITCKELMNRIVNYDTKYIVAWNKLYRRKLFDTIRYPKGKLHEDEFIIHELAWGCKNVSVISEQLYNYRIRENSIMQSKLNARNLDGFEAIYSRYQFIRFHNLTDLIPVMTRNVSRYYVYYTNNMNLENDEDRKRYEEIKQMAENTYQENKGLIDMKTKLAFRLPHIFWFLLNMKDKLRRKL